MGFAGPFWADTLGEKWVTSALNYAPCGCLDKSFLCILRNFMINVRQNIIQY